MPDRLPKYHSTGGEVKAKDVSVGTNVLVRQRNGKYEAIISAVIPTQQPDNPVVEVSVGKKRQIIRKIGGGTAVEIHGN